MWPIFFVFIIGIHYGIFSLAVHHYRLFFIKTCSLQQIFFLLKIFIIENIFSIMKNHHIMKIYLMKKYSLWDFTQNNFDAAYQQVFGDKRHMSFSRSLATKTVQKPKNWCKEIKIVQLSTNTEKIVHKIRLNRKHRR